MQATGGSAEVANSIGTRQIISQGSMSVEVTDVPSAATRVRAIAEGVGGFVEQLSSHGVGEFQKSTITVRVPQDEFFSVFEQIKSLGKVQNENAGTEDITERFIDL
jgi:ribosome maturation protein Sdo1